jgi:hypothetical protein
VQIAIAEVEPGIAEPFDDANGHDPSRRQLLVSGDVDPRAIRFAEQGVDGCGPDRSGMRSEVVAG